MPRVSRSPTSNFAEYDQINYFKKTLDQPLTNCKKCVYLESQAIKSGETEGNQMKNLNENKKWTETVEALADKYMPITGKMMQEEGFMMMPVISLLSDVQEMIHHEQPNDHYNELINDIKCAVSNRDEKLVKTINEQEHKITELKKLCRYYEENGFIPAPKQFSKVICEDCEMNEDECRCSNDEGIIVDKIDGVEVEMLEVCEEAHGFLFTVCNKELRTKLEKVIQKAKSKLV